MSAAESRARAEELIGIAAMTTVRESIAPTLAEAQVNATLAVAESLAEVAETADQILRHLRSAP